MHSAWVNVLGVGVTPLAFYCVGFLGFLVSAAHHHLQRAVIPRFNPLDVVVLCIVTCRSLGTYNVDTDESQLQQVVVAAAIPGFGRYISSLVATGGPGLPANGSLGYLPSGLRIRRIFVSSKPRSSSMLTWQLYTGSPQGVAAASTLNSTAITRYVKAVAGAEVLVALPSSLDLQYVKQGVLLALPAVPGMQAAPTAVFMDGGAQGFGSSTKVCACGCTGAEAGHGYTWRGHAPSRCSN